MTRIFRHKKQTEKVRIVWFDLFASENRVSGRTFRKLKDHRSGFGVVFLCVSILQTNFSSPQFQVSSQSECSVLVVSSLRDKLELESSCQWRSVMSEVMASKHVHRINYCCMIASLTCPRPRRLPRRARPPARCRQHSP